MGRVSWHCYQSLQTTNSSIFTPDIAKTHTQTHATYALRQREYLRKGFGGHDSGIRVLGNED